MMARLGGVRSVAGAVPLGPRCVYALKAKLVYVRKRPGFFGAGFATVATGGDDDAGGGASDARAVDASDNASNETTIPLLIISPPGSRSSVRRMRFRRIRWLLNYRNQPQGRRDPPKPSSQ